MPMEYKLRIKSVEVEDVESFQDLVRIIHWGVKAYHTDHVDSEGNPIAVYDDGRVPLTIPDVANFKPYDQIERRDVINWIRDYYENRVDEEDRVENWVQSTKQKLQSQLQAKVTPRRRRRRLFNTETDV